LGESYQARKGKREKKKLKTILLHEEGRIRHFDYLFRIYSQIRQCRSRIDPGFTDLGKNRDL
jgi:hypothetical protein